MWSRVRISGRVRRPRRRRSTKQGDQRSRPRYPPSTGRRKGRPACGPSVLSVNGSDNGCRHGGPPGGATCYRETVPFIVMSRNASSTCTDSLPCPRSPAYAFVPLVILQCRTGVPGTGPTVIQIVPLAPNRMRTSLSPEGPSRSTHLPRSEITRHLDPFSDLTTDRVKGPRAMVPRLSAPSILSLQRMRTVPCHASLALAPEVPLAAAATAAHTPTTKKRPATIAKLQLLISTSLISSARATTRASRRSPASASASAARPRRRS